MNGLMMDVPLTITSIVRHAERVHGHKEIVSITRDNPRHRYTYRDCFARARQLAGAPSSASSSSAGGGRGGVAAATARVGGTMVASSTDVVKASGRLYFPMADCDLRRFAASGKRWR